MTRFVFIKKILYPDWLARLLRIKNFIYKVESCHETVGTRLEIKFFFVKKIKIYDAIYLYKVF